MKGRKGYDPQALFKSLLFIYLGFASSERDLAQELAFDGRLTYLCGFSYGETPKHNTFHYFRERLGKEIFSEIMTNLIEAFRNDDEAAGNEQDGNFLPELTDESSATLTNQGKKINAVLADAGYDSTVIAANPRAGQNAIQRGLHRERGRGYLFKDTCYKGRYGPTFYLKEDHGVQDIMKAIRSTKGIKEVSIHVFMSICAYLTKIIAGMKLKTGLLPV